MLVRAPAHRFRRRDQHGFARGRQGRKERDRDADRQPHRRFVPRQRDRRGTARRVERVHGAGDQLHGPARQETSESKSQGRARQPEQRRLRQEQREHRGSRSADRAQDADLRTAPHHAYGDRVVDQERADYQGNVAQHAQVPPEGAHHALILLAARAGLSDEIRTRQHGADLPLDPVEIFAGADGDVDAVELAVAPE